MSLAIHSKQIFMKKRARLLTENPENFDRQGYYSWLANLQGKMATHTMEKGYGLIPGEELKHAFPNGKFLIIVRDPRDALMSMRALDARRGYRGFVDQEHYTIEEVVGHIANSFDMIIFSIRCLNAHVVRYEDMIWGRNETLKAVTAYLGVSAMAAVDPVAYPHHQTARSDILSVGRWRQEMDTSTLALCTAAWKKQLEYFGYALA